MSYKNNHSVDMLHGPMLKKILFFALPLAAGSILQQLFNAVDTAVVGKFASSEALAAVGSNTSAINLFINLFVGISIGSNVIIAQFIGMKKPENVSKAVHTSLIVALISGITLLFAVYFLARPLLILMGSPENVIDMAVLYLRIYCLGMPFIMLYNFTAAILRSTGDTRHPLYCLLTAGVINALLNLFLVVVVHLAVAGVAIATVVSNIVSASMALYFLQHSDEMIRISPSKLRINPEVLLPILKIGLPSGIHGVVFSLSNVCIQSSVNSFGSDAMAGSSIANNFEMFSFLLISGFSSAVLTFMGQNLGAGNLKRCLRAYGIGFACAFIAACTMNTTVFLSRRLIVGLFTSDSAAAAYAFERMRYALVLHCLISTYEIAGAAMRALGKSIVPSLISIFGTCLFRLLYVNIFIPTHHEFRYLIMVYPISWVMTGIVTITAFVLVWKHQKIKQKPL